MKLKDKLNRFFEKLRYNKKLQISLVVASIFVILVLYITYSGSVTHGQKDASSNSSFSTEEYVSSLENKLENVLSNIDGAGKVNVAITVSSGYAFEYAYEETSKESLSGNSLSTSIVLVENEPVVISETFPKIAGVLVIAEGGGKISVKLDILKSIQTLLDVANENITILGGKF